MYSMVFGSFFKTTATLSYTRSLREGTASPFDELSSELNLLINCGLLLLQPCEVVP